MVCEKSGELKKNHKKEKLEKDYEMNKNNYGNMKNNASYDDNNEDNKDLID